MIVFLCPHNHQEISNLTPAESLHTQIILTDHSTDHEYLLQKKQIYKNNTKTTMKNNINNMINKYLWWITRKQWKLRLIYNRKVIKEALSSVGSFQVMMDYAPDADRARETACRCPKKQARRIKASADKIKICCLCFTSYDYQVSSFVWNTHPV